MPILRGFFISLLLAGQATAAQVSVLIDLDPASAAQTVIIESVAADSRRLLYTCDRVTGNVLRIDPKSPKPVVVGRVEERDIGGKKVRANVSGIAFSRTDDLYLTAGGFGEILRIPARELVPDKPGIAQTFATRTEGANGIAFDAKGRLYVSGGRNGKIYRIPLNGGAAEDWANIELHARKLPDGKNEQAITANGLIFDKSGSTLYVADTARGAIWKIAVGTDGTAAGAVLLGQSPLLEGADGPDFAPNGDLWVAANERNAIVAVAPDGKVSDVTKNASGGPLEFPTAVVFVGGVAYVSNFDTARRDNLAADGKTSIDGIGASIIRIEP
jgi:sugar lactone lactonase YvrE